MPGVAPYLVSLEVPYHIVLTFATTTTATDMRKCADGRSPAAARPPCKLKLSEKNVFFPTSLCTMKTSL